MEIGEYATNVISNNDFSSIDYLYLEPGSEEFANNTIIEAEKSWRQSGRLVVRDPHRPGVWAFGTSDQIHTFRDLVTAETQNSNIDKQNETTEWTVLQDGTYTPNTFFKALKVGPGTGPPSNTTGPLNGSVVSDHGVQSAQVQNLRASQINGSQSTPASQDLLLSHTPAKDAGAPANDRQLHENFISAVLASVVLHLTASGSMLPLNARTMVKSDAFAPNYISQASEGEPLITIITLDIQMTAQNTLVLKTATRRAEGMGCFTSATQISTLLNSTAAGVRVFMGPSGQVGTCIGLDPGEPCDSLNSPRWTTAAQSNLNNQSKGPWKKLCMEYFHTKGVSPELLGSCRWLYIRIAIPVGKSESIESPSGMEDTFVTIQWPAPLCYFNRRRDRDARKSSHKLEDYDPLSFAEKWLSEQSERDNATSKRLKEHELSQASERAQPEGLPTTIITQALRRSSNAGAIYPTPPDGIQNIVGATPTFDGSASTPAVPPISSAPNVVDASDTGLPSKDGLEDNDTKQWNLSQDKKNDIAPELDFHDQSTDNLFDDVDGDLFGESNITDADFSFFDEPDLPMPNHPGAQKLTHAAMVIDGGLDNHTESTPQMVPESQVLDDSIFDSPNDTAQVDFDTNFKEPSAQAFGPDTAPEIDIFTNQIVEPPPRTITPPLNPEDVFKRLSSMNVASSQVRNLDSSAFAGLAFDPTLPSFTSKYGSQGRFDSPIATRTIPRTTSISLPKTDYMHKRQRRRYIITDKLTPGSSDFPSPLRLTKGRRNSQSDADSDTSSREGTPLSDQDDASELDDDPLPVTPSKKRKRGHDDDENDDHVSSSFQGLQMESNKESVDAIDPIIQSKLFVQDVADWSLAPCFRLLRPDRYLIPFEDEEYIAIAQTLAEQAMSATFRLDAIKNLDQDLSSDSQHHTTQQIVRHEVIKAAQTFLNKTANCTLSAYLDIQDGANVGQHRLPPRPMPANSRTGMLPEAPRSMFPLGAPHLEVSRADARLTVIPSAVPFWFSLGLGPAKGAKDVSAVVIQPRAIGLFDNVKAFLDHIGSAYETGHLGSHERFSTADYSYELIQTNSLDPLSLQSADQLTAPTYPSFQEINTRLGSELTASNSTGKNFVIYYLYDPSTPEVLVHICSAFHNLFELYKASFVAAKTPITNELVLQLVPLSFVASTSALVIPPPTDYFNLAMEVYDRCIDLKTGTASPAIVLEKPLPRIIDFKLTSNPSPSLLQENSVMHVAYAQSVDDRWITAAWTDNTGNTQFSAAYSLGRKLATTPLSLVAAEIWDTTLNIIAFRKVNWRIMIARCGVMQPSEIDFWKTLAAADSNPQLSITLITIDTKPSLQLVPPAVSSASNTLAAQSSLYTTPVSTPQASIVSPEQSGTAATPGGANPPVSTPTDNTEIVIAPDALLVDIREQSWGAILSHRLDNSNSLLDFNPALVSGYLIKRGGTTHGDIPVLMEVNIVKSEVNPRLYEALLREILIVYRGLGTLTRVRGRVDQARDVRPWHVAAAEKAADVLYMLM